MIIQNWDSSINYEKWNVVKKNNKLFFVLINNLGVDPEINNQTNNSINPVWNTEDNFCWVPSYDSNIESSVYWKKFSSDEGLLTLKDYLINKNAKSLNLTFDKLSDNEAAAIIVFLENKLGSKRFGFLAQNPYNQYSQYICKSWKHNWIFRDNNTISTVFERKF